MEMELGQIALVVRDYDEAIDFYTGVLSFDLVEDTRLTDEKRWVVVRPKNSSGKGCSLLLARAANENQRLYVGNQTGGRVFLFLYTDNLKRDYQNLLKHGVTIIRNPSEESFGKVLVFADLYGNLWDLIQRNISGY